MNQWRSPTAERLWSKSDRLNVRSAGTSASARRRVSERDLEWADVVLVMEHRHRDILRERFGDAARDVKIEVLDIGDDFQFMDADLVTLLQQRVRDVFGDAADP
ncbi:MAG: protein tyrosine phosphatase [Acidobacteriota bacterium]|nr:protein tyrosine phosphatase [Acidobacteriota bacterium]